MIDPLDEKAMKQALSDATLGLSFWNNFRDEVASICKRFCDFDDRPYISFEGDRGLLQDAGRTALHLKIQCGCFEFSASLDPVSRTISYATHVAGMENVLGEPRVLVESGIIVVSSGGNEYTVRAIPALEELDIDLVTCGYNEFWQVAKKLGGWACASLILRRLEKFEQLVKRQHRG